MESQPLTRKGESWAPDSWRCFDEESESGIYIIEREGARVFGYHGALDNPGTLDLSLTWESPFPPRNTWPFFYSDAVAQGDGSKICRGALSAAAALSFAMSNVLRGNLGRACLVRIDGLRPSVVGCDKLAAFCAPFGNAFDHGQDAQRPTPKAFANRRRRQNNQEVLA
jgi:hypothetical protein